MQKVKTFSDIEKHLDVGCRVLVKYNNAYCVFSPDKDPDGHYWESGFYDTESEAWWRISEHIGATIEEWSERIEDGVWIVDVKHPPRKKMFQKGDEVECVSTGEAYTVKCRNYNHNKTLVFLYYIAYDKNGKEVMFEHHQLRYPIIHDKPELTKEEALKEVERLKKYIKSTE